MAKVIVVDDNEMILELTKKLFEKIGGFEVLATDRVSKVILDYDPGDIVIFDMNMNFGGLVNCVGFVETLRNIDPQAKCIVYTGAAFDPALKKLKDMGVNDYMLKPVTAKVAVDKVRRLMEE